LAILKTLVVECGELFQRVPLTVFFLEQEYRNAFDQISTESLGTELLSGTRCAVIGSVEEMPFWQHRQQIRAIKKQMNQKSTTIVASKPPPATIRQPLSCSLCRRLIDDQVDLAFRCTKCSIVCHDICVEVETDEREDDIDYQDQWPCPNCGYCETSISDIEDESNAAVPMSESSSSDEKCASVSELVRPALPRRAVSYDLEESTDDSINENYGDVCKESDEEDDRVHHLGAATRAETDVIDLTDTPGRATADSAANMDLPISLDVIDLSDSP
jgi:hypothetical protein